MECAPLTYMQYTLKCTYCRSLSKEVAMPGAAIPEEDTHGKSAPRFPCMASMHRITFSGTGEKRPQLPDPAGKSMHGKYVKIHAITQNRRRASFPGQYHLAALPTGHQVEALLELIDGELMGQHRPEVEAAQHHLGHLVPGLEHL